MRGLPADDRPPLGQQLWQRGVDRGRRLSFAFVGPDLGAVKIRLDIRTGLAWPGVTNSRTTDITGFRTTGNASIMAAGTSYTTTSVLEAGALVQCHDGAPLRLSHALLLGENPRMSLFDEIRNATLAHPHRCGDFDAAARRFDAQIQVFDGFARQVQMDAINIQRLPGGSGPNGFRRTGLRSGGLTTAIRHASHSCTTADNKRHTMPPLTNRQPALLHSIRIPTAHTGEGRAGEGLAARDRRQLPEDRPRTRRGQTRPRRTRHPHDERLRFPPQPGQPDDVTPDGRQMPRNAAPPLLEHRLRGGRGHHDETAEHDGTQQRVPKFAMTYCHRSAPSV